MILIGQYDSSFVRRVAIALRIYGMDFEHRPWSVFGDADRLREVNPLMRVPTLITDDGSVLGDSTLILSYVDSLVPEERRLWPRDDWTLALKIFGLASGLADKGVSLFYEKVLHESPSPVWMERCEKQILETLATLELERSASSGLYFFGDAIAHPDIAVTAAMQHVKCSHPDLVDLSRHPSLAKHCEAMEALPVFREIYQDFIPPA